MVTVDQLITAFYFGLSAIIGGLVFFLLGFDALRTGKVTPHLKGFRIGNDFVGGSAELYGVNMLASGGLGAVCGLLTVTSIFSGNLAGMMAFEALSMIGLIYAFLVHFLMLVIGVIL